MIGLSLYISNSDWSVYILLVSWKASASIFGNIFWYFSEMEWSVSGTLSPVTIMSSYLATKIFHISSKEKICHPPSDQLKWFSKIFWILQKYFQIMSFSAAFLCVEVSNSGLVLLVKNCSVYVFIVPVVKKYDSPPLSPHSVD